MNQRLNFELQVGSWRRQNPYGAFPSFEIARNDDVCSALRVDFTHLWSCIVSSCIISRNGALDRININILNWRYWYKTGRRKIKKWMKRDEGHGRPSWLVGQIEYCSLRPNISQNLSYASKIQLTLKPDVFLILEGGDHSTISKPSMASDSLCLRRLRRPIDPEDWNELSFTWAKRARDPSIGNLP